MSIDAIRTRLDLLQEYREVELYGDALMRQLARAGGMTFGKVVDDLDAALLSRDRQTIRDFFASRSN
ncbi:hypothetical protein XI06_15155 [Bradyrhizobium sp. CCBAU 11434]|uniref:hypothetical protein n=1 Tax=Bradyrhizobium sp. CCBAU 11434 TaxID=1630885 RepID=UPI0023060B5A|nr:hypothetical protein [Bradyrhizobium sp. CCBAU 11434]MDA9521644.1 hypothetical protein [Bradyrhizobium sp. CCBAU 11434]